MVEKTDEQSQKTAAVEYQPSPLNVRDILDVEASILDEVDSNASFFQKIEKKSPSRMVDDDDVGDEVQMAEMTQPRRSVVDDQSIYDGVRLEMSIADIHKKWKLSEHQFTSSKEMLKKITFNVPLNELYEVVASCNYNAQNVFCPVLIKIMDETAKERDGTNRPYLLQVWNNKGEMAFERALQYPVSNWNIANDVFMFQEDALDPNIFVVKLYLDRTPFVYKLTLPNGIVDDVKRKNTKWDTLTERFVLPGESQKVVERDDDRHSQASIDLIPQEADEIMEPIVNLANDIYMMQSRDGHMISNKKVAPELFHQDKKSVSEQFEQNDIIQRAPDKMMHKVDGVIILAWLNDLIIIDCQDEGILQGDEPDGFGQENFKHIKLVNDSLQFLKLRDEYKIIALQDIGSDSTLTQVCVVLEDLKDRLIRYLKIDYDSGKVEKKRRLLLSQLGVMVTKSKMSPSPLLKYRAIARVDPATNKSFHIGIVVRKNGRWEVYSDFMLVYDWYMPNSQCVDVETDFNLFYLKFCDQTEENPITDSTQFSELKFNVRQVFHIWRNRICYDTTKAKKSEKSWDTILHKRIANYFNIYTQILNYQMYMLVSHRDMISVYKMAGGDKEEQWKTHALDLGTIRQMFIKKKSQKVLERQQNLSNPNLNESAIMNDKTQMNVFALYQIAVLSGTHTVSLHNLSKKGKLSIDEDTTNAIQSQLKHRILRFKNDDYDKFGIFIFSDDKDMTNKTTEYEDVEGCQLYTFPFKRQGTSQYTLRTIKQGAVVELITSAEYPDLAYDSYFRTIKSSKGCFERKSAEFGQENANESCHVTANFDKKKKNLHAMVITSDLQGTSKMFPIQHKQEKQDDGTKQISEIELVKNEKNTRQIETDKNEDDDPPINSFCSHSEEFGDNKDNYIQISKKQVKVFDTELAEKWTLAGLNIRNCKEIQQSYLYTLQDQISDFYVSDESQGDGNKIQINHFAAAGLYVYDIGKLLTGRVEKYKLAKAIGGVCNLMDNSMFSDRFSFLKNYDAIVVMPFPHLNTINCVGMGQKHNYLMWREKNGFFTALDKTGSLQTWSLLTGKQLYEENLNDGLGEDGNPKQGSKFQTKTYEVYRGDEKDITYTRNSYNYRDRSIQLLYSVSPFNDAEQKQTFVKEVMAAKFKSQIASARKANVHPDVPALHPNIITAYPEMEINLKESMQNQQIHHFKVLQLRTYEDLHQIRQEQQGTKENKDESEANEEGSSEVKMLFHFAFPKYQKSAEAKAEMDGDIGDYEWDISGNPIQRLYLSKDTTLLLEVVNGFIGTVYERVNLDSNGSIEANSKGAEAIGQCVRWKVKYRIKQFPQALSNLTSVPYLFSPNFTYQLDFHLREEYFMIKETDTRALYFKIPKDFLPMTFGEIKSIDAIQLICSRFQWISEKVIRIINESNMDCLLEICSTDPDDKDIDQRSIKLLSAVKVDNLFENQTTRDSPHLLLDKKEVPSRDVLDRLIRLSQNYKVELVHAQNLGQTDMREKLDKDFRCINQINSIDFFQPWGQKMSSFDLQLTYTALDWKIGETVMMDKAFNVKDVEQEQRVQLCFNIWPAGQSLMHMLSSQGVGIGDESTGDFIQDIQSAQSLFEVCAEYDPANLTCGNSLQGEVNFSMGIDKDRVASLELPILPNMYGYTALDYCLPGDVPAHHVDTYIFTQDAKQQEILSKSENVVLGGLLFEGITEYGFMHSSTFIASALMDAIALGESFALEYLNASLKEVDHFFQNKTQFEILPSVVSEIDGIEYGITQASVWCHEQQIKSQLFEKEGTLQPMELKFLDVQYAYKNTKIGRDFIYALVKCENGDFFTNSVVQIIIDHQWSYWLPRSILLLGLPITTQLMIFVYWSNVVIPNLQKDSSFRIQNDIASFCIIVLSCYLLLSEIPLLIQWKLKWFYHLGSVVNAISDVLLIINCVKVEVDNTAFWTIQAISALLAWWRFVLYLRTFERFSWMVRLIQTTFYDMRYFLILFFFIIFSFADAFLSIEQNLRLRGAWPLDGDGNLVVEEVEEDLSFYDTYLKTYVGAIKMSYLTSIGEFDDVFGEYRDSEWIFFLLSTIINVIVLLNALIAITGETFGAIWETQVGQGYREKVNAMQQLQLGYFWLFDQKEDANERLFVAYKMRADTAKIGGGVKSIQNQMSALSEQVDSLKNDLKDNMDKKLQQMHESIIQVIESQGNPVQKKLGMTMHGGFALDNKLSKKTKNSKHGVFMQMQSRGKGKQTQQNYNF